MKTTSKGLVRAVVAVMVVLLLAAAAYAFIRTRYSVPANQIALRGEYECLPLKNGLAQPTEGCILGFKTAEGYYAIETTAIQNSMEAILSLPEGTETMIYGELVPADQLDADTSGKYDVKGLVIVTGASSV